MNIADVRITNLPLAIIIAIVLVLLYEWLRRRYEKWKKIGKKSG